MERRDVAVIERALSLKMIRKCADTGAVLPEDKSVVFMPSADRGRGGKTVFRSIGRSRRNIRRAV